MSLMGMFTELLVCSDCGFQYDVGAAAKPVCPECRSRMDLVTGLPDEVRDIHSNIKKAESLEEIQGILKSINSLTKDRQDED
jgi:DNA-directed RNA polymerase subunit RPC12/RpoP